MRHMDDNTGKALCGTVNYSMNLTKIWDEVTCKRCLRSVKKKNWL